MDGCQRKVAGVHRSSEQSLVTRGGARQLLQTLAAEKGTIVRALHRLLPQLQRPYMQHAVGASSSIQKCPDQSHGETVMTP